MTYIESKVPICVNHEGNLHKEKTNRININKGTQYFLYTYVYNITYIQKLCVSRARQIICPAR